MMFVMEELNGIQNRIYEVRGVRVMLDFDLAALYQVETRVLKQAVRRNLDRFPEDFMFEVTEYEYNSLIISLRSQFVTSSLYPCSRLQFVTLNKSLLLVLVET